MNWRQVDAIDTNILRVLQEHGRVTNAELAERVGLSPSPCLARTKALEEDGFILRYTALLEPRAIGLSVSVFVQVSLDRQVEPNLTAFEKAIAKRTEVMECYLMMGTSD